MDGCSVYTMPKFKVIPKAIRKQIVELCNNELTYGEIAERVKLKYSTVGAIVQKHQETGAICQELELLTRSHAALNAICCLR